MKYIIRTLFFFNGPIFMAKKKGTTQIVNMATSGEGRPYFLFLHFYIIYIL